VIVDPRHVITYNIISGPIKNLINSVSYVFVAFFFFLSEAVAQWKNFRGSESSNVIPNKSGL